MEFKSQPPLSVKLVNFLQSEKNHHAKSDHDDIIRLLRGGEGRECLRLYLSISSVDHRSLLPSYEVHVLKVHTGVKSLYSDRLFDCSDTTLPLVKVKFDFRDDNGNNNNSHTGRGNVNGNNSRSNGKGMPLSHLLIREISQKGFTFLDEQYHFLAFKDLGTDFAYFFPQSGSDRRYLNSCSLWQSIGNFCALPHVPAVGLRLGLLVSAACGGCAGEDIDIRILDDVYVAENKDEVATGMGRMISVE